MVGYFVLVSNCQLLKVPDAEAAPVQSHSGPVHLHQGAEKLPSWDEDGHGPDHHLEFVCAAVECDDVWHQGYIPRRHVSWVHNGIVWHHLSDEMYAMTRWTMHRRNLGIYLTTGKAFNKTVDNTVLPSGLQYLTFGKYFNQNMDNTNLPSGLQSLTFSGSFNQNMDNTNLPNGLHSLI